MKKSVVGSRNGSPQACLSRILRLLVEEEKGLFQQVFCERHGLHPAGILEMGRVGSEVKVGLKSPSVEGLKFVKELRRHSSGDACKPGGVDCVGGEQDT